MPDRERFGPPSTDEWHTIKWQVEQSTLAREKYVPIIERMDERVDALSASIDRQTEMLSRLLETITPMITERAMILKVVRFAGGVAVGIVTSIATWALIEWLKSRG